MGDEHRTGGARVAIVYPIIDRIRGGEKVLFEIARLLPEADLFALHYRPEIIPDEFAPRLHGTFLQRPVINRVPFRAYLPVLPAAVRSLPTDDYDLIVSISSGWSHGAPKRAGAQHLCYMFTPPRYLWHEEPPNRIGRVLRSPLELLLRRLRAWDVEAAAGVDKFIALSEITKDRIAERYGRDADIVFPPVDVDRWLTLDRPQKDHVVAAGRLVPYKRFDLAVDACRLAGVPLTVVGDGPQRRVLERHAAGTDVTFLGDVDDATYRETVASARAFIFPGIEDFGIVTVEALAAGVPVVGSSVGGTGEIATPGTGVLVDEPSGEAFAAALRQVLETDYDRNVLRARALDFAPERFRTAISAAVQSLLGV